MAGSPVRNKYNEYFRHDKFNLQIPSVCLKCSHYDSLSLQIAIYDSPKNLVVSEFYSNYASN